MIGKADHMLVPVDRRREFKEIMRLLREEQHSAHVETTMLSKDGRALAVSISISPINDAGGTMIGTSTIAQDIGEQAAQSETGLRRLADSNIIGIVFWNLDGNITWANDYFLKMVGYTREELLAGNVRWKDMTPEEYALVDARAIEELKAHRALAAPFEKEYIRKDGSRVPVLLGSALLDTSQHEGVSFILDVSERKELRQKDEFINMASHELRTPLTCMLGYTDLLRLLLEAEGSQQAIQYVSKMEVQLEKLHRLIADLLDISKAQAGKLVYAKELVAMDELVREVVEDVQLTTSRHRIVIEAETNCECGRGPGPPGTGDRQSPEQCHQVLSPGRNRCAFAWHRTAEEIIVSVQDFGIGIPSDSQERVFERFYRGSIHVEQRFPGLGIGLYIAHQIVSHHGGRIWVESTEGQGSTFSFALPLKQGSLPLENAQEMKQSILVIDDEPAILDIVQTILTRERYRVQTSSNGACLHSLESDLPDLILLDVLLQGEDGRELCRQLKEREQTRHIPVILFSAHVPAKGAPESCGADDFLSKPFRIKELLAIVARWTGPEQNG